MSYAIVENGIVINICLWDGVTPWGLSSVAIACSATVGIGWSYDGTTFTAPTPPTPPSP